MSFSFGAKPAVPSFSSPGFLGQNTGNTLFNVPTSVPQSSNLFGSTMIQQNTPNTFAQSTGVMAGITNTIVGTGGLSLTTSASATPVSSFGASNVPKVSLFSTPTTLPVSSAPSNFGSRLGTVPNLGFDPTKVATVTSSVTSDTTNFGLGSSGGIAEGSSFGLTGTSNAVRQPPIGLGGVPASAPLQHVTAKTELLAKEQALPNELQQTVGAFKIFVKLQKGYSSDVARCSVKEFKQVETDIDSVTTLLNDVEKELQTNRNVAEKLKYDTAKGLQQVEMAQRTHDTPVGLQYENTSPLNFFMDLVDSFEREMQNMKLQIENTDKYVKNIGTPTPLNSQDLALGMRRIHDTFVALAGRLQSVHSQVQSQKDHYLNFRKYILNDSTNVFEKPIKDDDALNAVLNTIYYQPPTATSTAGPTPFNSMSHPSVVQATQSAKHQTPSAQGFGASSLSGFGTPSTSFNMGTSGMSMFGNNTFGQTINSPSSSFQLQKPPMGNKRGKP